jgi:hypothetical protein
MDRRSLRKSWVANGLLEVGLAGRGVGWTSGRCGGLDATSSNSCAGFDLPERCCRTSEAYNGFGPAVGKITREVGGQLDSRVERGGAK